MPPELLGPLGLTAALAFAVGALWREHLRADADDRIQRDRAIAVSEAQTDATERVARNQEELVAAFREFVREQATRQRRGDP
jgi:predicted outer membrane lipoprotein